MHILVINCGSSSLKYELFTSSKKNLTSKEEGLIDRIGQKGQVKNHEQAVKKVLAKIGPDVDAVGHRVVHGGEKYTQATKIKPAVIEQIRKLSKLAPLHNPPNLAGIKACQKLLPKVPQVAIFDTSFHQTMPPKAYLYALPQNLYAKKGIRRYGFHGSSHSYVGKETYKLLNKKNAKIVTVHLGNGSSITAIDGGKSVDTTMGYTPLEGLPMGTRSGDLDPSVVLLLSEKLGTKKADELLNKKSGLKGISGFSSDMRDLWHESKKKTAKGKRAQLAMTILSYKIAKYIGAYSATLKGLDAVTFTGGIGEKAHYIRNEVCGYLSHLGVKLDASKNRSNKTQISSKGSKVKVFVIPTDEEKEIAAETVKILN